MSDLDDFVAKRTGECFLRSPLVSKKKFLGTDCFGKSFWRQNFRFSQLRVLRPRKWQVMTNKEFLWNDCFRKSFGRQSFRFSQLRVMTCHFLGLKTQSWEKRKFCLQKDFPKQSFRRNFLLVISCHLLGLEAKEWNLVNIAMFSGHHGDVHQLSPLCFYLYQMTSQELC